VDVGLEKYSNCFVDSENLARQNSEKPSSFRAIACSYDTNRFSMVVIFFSFPKRSKLFQHPHSHIYQLTRYGNESHLQQM